MKSIGKSIFLSIAGFTIKIRFHRSIALNGKLSPQEVQTTMLEHNEGFIIKKTKKYDFLIEFIEKGSYIYNKKGSQVSVDVFQESGKRKLITYTHISRSQFVYVLRYVINKLIVNSGFVLHSSANLVKHRAMIYFGPSGAGKSTIVSLLQNNFPILSDDECYIRKEKNKFYYYQGPFLEKKYNYTKTSKRYNLGNFYCLYKDKHCKVGSLMGMNKAISKVARQVWIGTKKNEAQTLVNITQLIHNVKCYPLFFSKNKKQLLSCVSSHS